MDVATVSSKHAGAVNPNAKTRRASSEETKVGLRKLVNQRARRDSARVQTRINEMISNERERNPFRLDGETALITGGGSGLGLGMAQCMVNAGATVVIVGRRRELLEDACGELGENAHFVVHDVNKVNEADALIEEAERKSGSPITALINNAGVHLKKPATDTTPEEFENVMRTHVTGAHALTRAVLPGMCERGHGSILFIASMTSFIGMPWVIAYAAAKSAHVGLVRSLAVEVSSKGVRVNAIAPGWVDSAMTRKAMEADPERKRKILSRTPMGRFGEPDDIGNAAVYLCSPAAKFVTGVLFPVDGGAAIGF